MKVLKQRQAHIEFEVFCSNCKSELLANKYDIAISKYGGYIACPCCSHSIQCPTSYMLAAQRGYPRHIVDWVNQETEKLNYP